MAAPTPVTVRIVVAGVDISADVIFSQTTFSSSAMAQPGTCHIVVRDPDEVYSFVEGSTINLWIDDGSEDRRSWRGFLFDVEMGYVMEDYAYYRQWVLGGVDLNILLDKLVLYNHANPTRFPDGGGHYKRRKVIEDGRTLGYQVTVPRYTYDGDYIRVMLNDFDIDKVSPRIRTGLIESVGMINPDGVFTPPSAGITLRDFLVDVSRNVFRSAPGSTIWYVDPDGYLVYRSQDRNVAPFWVGDEDPTHYIGGVQGENVRGLRMSRSISSIKNDALIFAGELDPQPSSRQTRLKYKHLINQESVDTYGRFQHSEVISNSWMQGAVNARANKIINQESTPGLTIDFTIFRPGLYPGQIVWVSSLAHGLFENVPIRAITMNFPQPNLVSYQVSCSFDTQDPWGLILALKRPPGRGLKQPDVAVIDLRRNPDQTITNMRPYTLVKEYPTSLGNNTYQCSFGYIRDSITVYVGKLRQVSLQDPEAGTVGFIQSATAQGKFRLTDAPAGGKRVYVEYHVSGNL